MFNVGGIEQRGGMEECGGMLLSAGRRNWCADYGCEPRAPWQY